MNVTKLSLLAAAAGLLATASGFADDQQLQNRVALQRQAADRNQTTVAVYSDKGLGRAVRMPQQAPEPQLTERSNPRGERTFIYAPAK